MSINGFEEHAVTVPLRDVQAVPVHERTGRSMTPTHEHLVKHFRVDTENARPGMQINEDIWTHNRWGPPSESCARAVRSDEDGESVVEAESAG